MIDLIRSRIETRLAEIDQEMSVLQDALAALHDGDGPRAPSPAAATQRAARARPRPTAAGHPLAPGVLERLLAENPGQTSTALATQANAAPEQVLALLKGLEAESNVRREGRGRGTRWFAYTDEDRIAERAAELEAQSRAVKAQRETGGFSNEPDTGTGLSRLTGWVADRLKG